MDNLGDKTKRNMHSTGDSDQLRPDPIKQTGDDPNVSQEGVQPTEIVLSAEKPIKKHLSKLLSPVTETDAKLLPNQFMRTGEPTLGVPSADELLVSILRFKWTILAVFIMVAAPTIAAIWTQIVPQYHAKAEVRVRPIIPRLVFRTEDSGPIPFYDSFVNTQVSIIMNLTVLQRVLDQQEVQETQWYKKPQMSFMQRLRGNTATPMERLRDNLLVRPRRRTEIIDVSFTDPSAGEAKLIVDTVLDQYIRYTREMSDATEDELYSQLVEQYKSIENDIRGREKITAELRKSLQTSTPQELISGKRVRLDEIQASLGELQRSIAVLEWEQKGLEDLMKQAITDGNSDVLLGDVAEMEKQRLYNEDAVWLQRDEKVRILRYQINNGLLTRNHPNRIQMEKDLEFAEELLRLREAQLDEQWRNRPRDAAEVPTTITGPDDRGYAAGIPTAITNMGGLGYAVGMPITIIGASGLSYAERLVFLEHQLSQAKQGEQLLLAELEKQQKDFKGLFETAQLLEKEDNELVHKRELFSAVRQRLDQKNMERNVPGSIEVLARAFASSRPSNDRRIVFTAMALVVGLGMGGGAAFLRASRNQAIYAPKDMPSPMQVPFLGYIPLIRTKKSPGKALYNEIEQNKVLLMESVRVVRTILLSRLNGQNSTTVLVTSAAAGTGKSSFTMMLGKSLAQVGKKVLVIDADLHKMSLTKQFGLTDKSGFMESLCYSSGYKRHIFPTETSNLSIMPVGKLSGNGQIFEETANGAFKICISQLRKQYNIILLDSPPILPVADAAILSNQVDGTIMVERELISRRSNVINAIARLDSAGGRLLGTVFVGSGGQEKYGYDYYYSRTGKT